ncbi:MAG: DUF5700 domain-containing putative Zn-dependent protease [Bacteroidales bacterium]|jgi:hypothetical protein|nr:hypothetical protein [Bacteroidales bacterium]
MGKYILIGFFMLCANINISIAQIVDLSSVDEFFKITTSLKEGKTVSVEQWKEFDSSSGYKEFTERQSGTLINTIKSSINIAFGNGTIAEKDSILNITQDEMNRNTTMLLKKLILTNYIDVNNNYDSIKSFRENYDFNALFEKSKQRLSSFLGKPIESNFEFKPVYFLFIIADGKNKEDGIYVDFNFLYKITEEQRINFLAHEFFHNYREKYEYHNSNFNNYLIYGINIIQNEGIADLIDKTEGYKTYFTNAGESPEMIETWVNYYNQAEKDLEELHNLIIKYSKNEISENEMEVEIQEIIKFNGHPIGFFMANHIVNAGYKNEMLNTFYNPFEFYSLYNKAAKEQNLFELSNEFMNYLENLTKQ